MITFLTVIHIIVCLFLVIIVLLQHGKGADMGATFGGGSQTVFGTGGAATFLGKVTVVAVVIFMLTSMSLAYLSSRSSTESLLKDEAAAKSQVQEAVQEKTEAPAADKNVEVQEEIPAAQTGENKDKNAK